MPCTSPKPNTTSQPPGIELAGDDVFDGHKQMDSAIIGSITCRGGEISPYMARPSVMECATVNAVACHSTGLRRGSRM